MTIIERTILLNQTIIMNSLQTLLLNDKTLPNDASAGFIHNTHEAIAITQKLLAKEETDNV